VIPLKIADQQQHIDEHTRLIATIEVGQAAILYWSQADQPGLVLGFSQKQAVLNQAVRVAHAMPIYQRRAGGTAVLVGPHLLSLDVVLPAGHPLILADIVESYHWFGEAWVEALRQLGVQTRIVLPQEAHLQRLLLKRAETQQREAILRRACYGALSTYEVVAGQRKVVGLDMLRRRAGSVLQAGVLLQWETEALAQLLGHTPEEQALLREGLHERAVGLDTLAGRLVDAQEVITAFERVLFSRYGQ
jgi:lipoate---protein ligase